MYIAVTQATRTEVKERIDVLLHEYCAAKMIDAQRIGERYSLLWESIAKLVNAGGKRFRPYMLLAAYNAYDQQGTVESITYAAMAQEFLHLAMLIHDDIIDRDTVRYGIKNVAGQYEESYTAYINDTQERVHMAYSTALLAGDVLLSEAYRLISRVDREPARVSNAIEILADGVFDVIGGELLDTENVFLHDVTISAETVAKYKTASYSFVSPLIMGATLAGAPSSEVSHLKMFAYNLGIAYQLRDDLLGVFGNTTTTGKSTSTDLTEGKSTYLIEQFEALASPTQKAAFSAVFHKADASEIELSTARELLIDSGAKAHVEQKIKLLGTRSKELIHQLAISETHKTVFYELVSTCLEREG